MSGAEVREVSFVAQAERKGGLSADHAQFLGTIAAKGCPYKDAVPEVATSLADVYANHPQARGDIDEMLGDIAEKIKRGKDPLTEAIETLRVLSIRDDGRLPLVVSASGRLVSQIFRDEETGTLSLRTNPVPVQTPQTAGSKKK